MSSLIFRTPRTNGITNVAAPKLDLGIVAHNAGAKGGGRWKC